MKKYFIILWALVASIIPISCQADESSPALGELNPIGSSKSKTLVAYFSATGNTQAVAEQISKLTGADIYKIEAAEPYAANPYDDSDRIQNEAYNDLRPQVANLPDAEIIAGYDTIFVGSPCWWHQPAMVVCTFLEAYDLKDKVIVPFITYGATTYLNETMQKIYRVTPYSHHIPETLPEDLNPDDITIPGPADDAGIDMPNNARDAESWLKRLGFLSENSGIAQITIMDEINMSNVYSLNGTKVGGSPTLASLNPGVYVINGRKTLVR